MGPFVFLVLVLIVKSECLESDRSHTLSESSDSAVCVCRPHVTINPPVCARSPTTNSEIGCNSSTIQGIISMEETVTRRKMDELQVTVSDNQETVSSELEDTRRKMDELQVAVSGNQETVSSELEDTRRKMDELQFAVSGNQETVSSELEDTRRKMDELQFAVSGNQETVSSELEDTRRKIDELQVAVSTNRKTVSADVRGIRQQLEELQVSVSVLVEHLHDTSSMNQARTTVDATERTATTEADTSPMNKASTVDATERTATTEADTSPMNKERTVDATERTATTEVVTLAKDCSDILDNDNASMSGVYTVQPRDSGEAFQVYCDMETDSGGWTVFQRRMDGSVDFYLDFANYSRGFGNLEGEFWLGNDYLHRLTAQGEYELRIDLADFEDESRYAVYESFSITNVSDNYRLTLGSYSGTAGDSLSHHNNNQFSTKDRDNDVYGTNCAQRFHGAWWYIGCHGSNLNGAYLRGTTTEYARGVVWRQWKEYYYSLKASEMKIRPTP